ncbi:hypothetical protein [Nostoc linckia]|nr:hypothetical protein [Nostoc linckia]
MISPVTSSQSPVNIPNAQCPMPHAQYIFYLSLEICHLKIDVINWC